MMMMKMRMMMMTMMSEKALIPYICLKESHSSLFAFVSHFVFLSKLQEYILNLVAC